MTTYEEYLVAGAELNRKLQGDVIGPPPLELLTREEWEQFNTQETIDGEGLTRKRS